MPRLLFILAALPIALANLYPARRESSACFSDQILCSGTEFGAYAQTVSTDNWLANATTIHDLFGLEKSGSFATTHAGQFMPLCCPTSYSICGLLLPGDVPVCYYPSGDYSKADKGPLFYLSDMSYGFENTGDYYNIASNHINLITGDYDYSNGTKGNWFVDRGERPPAVTTRTTKGVRSTSTKFISTTRTLVIFTMATDTATSKSSTLTGEATISTTSDHANQTLTDGNTPTLTTTEEANRTLTDGAANAQTSEGAGMIMGLGGCGMALWMAGAAVVFGYAL